MPQTDAFATTNSLSELALLATRLKLWDALEQPVDVLLEQPDIPSDLGGRLRPLLKSYPDALGDFLLNRHAWSKLKEALSQEELRLLLRATRSALQQPKLSLQRVPLKSFRRPHSAGFPAQKSKTQAQESPPEVLLPLLAQVADAGLSSSLRSSTDVLEDLMGATPLREFKRVFGWNLSVQELLNLRASRTLNSATNAPLELAQRSAVSWLRQLLSEQEEALGEESHFLATALGGPVAQSQTLLRLSQKLLALRGQLRESLAPLLHRKITERQLRMLALPPTFLYRDPRPETSRQRLQSVSATILLESWTEQIKCVCTCAAVKNGSCIHVLAALDAILLMFQTPGNDAELKSLVAELEIQPWERTLKLLKEAGLGENAQGRSASWPSDSRLIWKLQLKGRRAVSLKPMLQRPLKRGGYGAGTVASLDEVVSCSLPYVTGMDRRAANMLLALRYGEEPLLIEALRMVAPTGRVFGENSGAPLNIREVPLSLRLDEVAEGFQIRAVAEAAELPADVIAEFRSSGRSSGPVPFLSPDGQTLFLVQPSSLVLKTMSILLERGDRFPKAAGDLLVAQLEASGVNLVLPASLLGEEIPGNTKPSVFLSRPQGLELEVELRMRPLGEGLPFPAGEGPSVVRVGVTESGARRYVRRNFEEELSAATVLWGRLQLAPPAGGLSVRVEGMEAIELLKALEQLSSEGVEIVWPAKRPTLTRAAGMRDLSVTVREGRDWFGLAGMAEVDGETVELAALLEAARSKRRYVQIREDHFAEISQELLSRLEPLAQMTFDGKQGAEVNLSAADALNALGADLKSFEASASFRSIAERAQKSLSLTIPVPTELQATLRPYQREGFEWMGRLAEWGAGACLCDDMGLGKTLQALALLLRRASLGPALVVAPTSVCFNWQQETEKFAPSLKVIHYHHTDRSKVFEQLGPSTVLVASYGLVVTDLERFRQQRFATLVLDEAHSVKNAHTLRARAVRDLEADFRCALTGTPIENHLGELWSLFRAVMPGLLGSEESFKDRFWAPIERSRDPQRRKALSQVVQPFILRRTKSAVAQDLPPRIEVNVPVALTPAERKLYDEARLAVVGELQSSSSNNDQRFQVLAALTRMRLLACHPVLHDPTWTGPASKLQRVLELVDELREEGHRTLIFSQFTRHLALVRTALEKRGIPLQYLDGETPEAARRTRVEAFQRGEGDVFLLSLKAGGTGINLTGADNVIHLDPWWNPAVEDQATDRAHRIGQTRSVTVYRMLTTGTIEEAILALHKDKRELVAGILEGTEVAGRLSTNELAALLSTSATADEEATNTETPEELRAELTLALPPESPRALTGPGVVELSELIPEFSAWLGQPQGSRALTPGTVKSYTRAANRFRTYLEAAGHSHASADVLRAAIPKFLEALLQQTVQAPASEHGVARIALPKLVAFFEQRSGHDAQPEL